MLYQFGLIVRWNQYQSFFFTNEVEFMQRISGLLRELKTGYNAQLAGWSGTSHVI